MGEKCNYMQNLYDIRNKKKLLYILSNKNNKIHKLESLNHKIAIVVNLYYKDSIDSYMNYINEIPEEIDVYIISSKDIVLDRVDIVKKRSVYLIKKENRGRDISAFLVAFREYYFNYVYICFLHDKKTNHDRWKKDADIWIENLWENMVDSAEYIKNILQLFEEHENIGLLVPPEPIGEYYYAWYGDAWNSNFTQTVELANKLELNCDISRARNPITLGTVFWAKTDCLKKLIQNEWKYEDFDKEPLPLDGTISHAIERIIGYVAQDAGYDVATVMNHQYAEWMMLFVQDNMKKMHSLMKERLGIYNIHQLTLYEEQEKRIQNFCKKNSNVYIYGAGIYGKLLLTILKNLGYCPQGFVVGNNRRKEGYIERIAVYELNEILSDKEYGIIIAVDFNLQDEVENYLEKNKITNYIEGWL